LKHLQKAAALVLTLGAAGAIAFAADRIYTLPDPGAELKRLFPAATAFSPLAGQPLHFKAYAADPKANPSAPPIGIAFWTTDLVPQEHGYHGPIHILVGMDMTGILTGVIVTYDSEPYGYFSVQPPKFAAQFKGKSIRDPFRVGGDVDAVSRASITIGSAARAIRDSSRAVAKQLLPPEVVK
jgi:transcriptional regulator of nitric oxide reductase